METEESSNTLRMHIRDLQDRQIEVKKMSNISVSFINFNSCESQQGKKESIWDAVTEIPLNQDEVEELFENKVSH